MSLLNVFRNKENFLKLFQRILFIFCVVIGIIISYYLLKTIFDLGIYIGTFLRGLYSIVCN